MSLHLYLHHEPAGPQPLPSPPIRLAEGEAPPLVADWLVAHLLGERPVTSGTQDAGHPTLFTTRLPILSLRSAAASLLRSLYEPGQASSRGERQVRMELPDLGKTALDGIEVDLSIPLALLARDLATLTTTQRDASHIIIE